MKASLFTRKTIYGYLLAIFFLIVGIALFAQTPGSLDHRFNPLDSGNGAGYGFQNVVYASAMMSDGSLIVGGQFTSFERQAAGRVAKLTPDGKLDTTFKTAVGANSAVTALTVQTDGKVIIGGAFTTYNNVSRKSLARINTDGSLDTSFKIGTGFNNRVYSIAVQPDGKIVVGGYFTTLNGSTVNRIVRLESNGSIDVSFTAFGGFNAGVEAIDFQSNGKIIIAGWFTTHGTGNTSVYRMCRLDTNGSLDTTFKFSNGGFNYVVSEIAIQPDDKILAIGAYSKIENLNVTKIARIKANGGLDTAFYNNTQPGFAARNPNDVKILANGDIVIVGDFLKYKNQVVSRMIRLDSTGVWDTTASAVFNLSIAQVEYQSTSKKLIVTGSFGSINGVQRTYVSRLTDDWNSDLTYDPITGLNNTASTMIFQPNGKILIGGAFTAYNGRPAKMLLRIDSANGEVDTTFNSEGFTLSNGALSLGVQSDGKIIAGGWISTYGGKPGRNIVRVDSTGKADTTFPRGTGFNSTVQKLVIQPDGKVLCIGNFTTYNGTACKYIVRLKTDGTIDNSFVYGSGFNGVPYEIALQPDGKILVGGSFTSFNGTTVNRLVRLSTTGAVDATFNTNIGSGFNNHVWSGIVVQPDGKILVAGQFSQFKGASANRIIRLDSNGNRDASFTTSGPNNNILEIGLQSDGKIIAIGAFSTFGGIARQKIARLDSNGSTDITYNTSTGYISGIGQGALLLYPDDKALVCASNNYSYQGTGRNQLFRIYGGGSTPINNNLIDSSQNICNGDSAKSLTGSTPTGGAGSFTYSWLSSTSSSTSGFAIATGTNNAKDYSFGSILLQTTWYKRVVISGTENDTSNVIAITLDSLPSVTIRTDSTVSCNGFSNAGISAVVAGGTSAFKYSWSNGDTVASVVGLAAGGYGVTVTDSKGCVDTSAIVLTQPTKLRASVTVDTMVTCKDVTNGAATASPSGGTTGYSYKWSNSSNTASITGVNVGTYLVTISDSRGCTVLDSAVIGYSTTYVPPSVSFPNPSASCNNASPITLSGATPTGGVYSGSNVASGDFLPASAGIGTDTLYYTYTDTIGCITVDTAYVVVNGAPTVTFSSLSKICADNGLQPVIGGMPTGGNYKGNGVYLNNFYPDSSGVGSHNITYVFTNTDNCTDSATQAQVVNALPIVSFSTQNNWCLNASPIKLNSGTPTGGSYTVNGVVDTTYSSTKAGMDTIIYTFTDTNSCVNMDTAMIQADTVPVVTFSTLSDLCVGSANYTLVEGMPNANGTGMYSGNRVSAGKYSPSMVITDTLTYMFTDSNNCMESVTQTITVNALPVVAITSQAAICENTPSFALSGGTPAGGAYSGGGVSSGNYDASSFGTGTDNIKYVYSDGNNCKDSAMTTLVVNAVTKATLQYLGYTCNNTEVKNLTSSGIPVGGTFSGSGVSGTDFDPKVAGTGTHSISYVYTNTKNCQDSAKGDIIVEAAPVFNIEGDSVGCGTGIDVPLLKVNLAGMTYRWSNGSTSDTAIVTQNGKAWVKVIDPATQRLCFNTDTIIVKYDEVCVGLDENLSETKVNYYPNPNNGSFNYAVEGFNGMDVTVKVITANGQEVYRDVWNNVSDRTGEIHMDVMESGLYFIHLSTTKGSVVHRLEILK